MVDFSSALYLGLRHPSGALRPWPALTAGVPAAVAPPAGARRVAARLAALLRCERALLAPSTLHLFWDLFLVLRRPGMKVYVDDHAYPIARWGVERAVAARWARCQSFRHLDAAALARLLERDAADGVWPVVLADGVCPGCGGVAPVAELLEAVRPFGGLVVLDDTQALGILGRRPAAAPYGAGGGGTLAWHGIEAADVAAAGSLAKGFGAPLAVLAGSAPLVDRFEAASETRVHCSPPSAAAIHAAEHALELNQERGDFLRRRLASLVRRFRRGVAALGLRLAGGLFPVQSLEPIPGLHPAELHERLLRRGVRAVLHEGGHGRGTRASFLITARHRRADVDMALEALAGAVAGRARGPVGGV